MNSSVIRVDQWLDENRDFFKPPVCNRLMHSDQLKVMFVGGPNLRKDFHMQCGEELFYQIRGDMILRVLETPTTFRDVLIKEGDIFLLPARTYHSPQRMADTMGLVVERHREEQELDCVRYFSGDTTQPLFERWFYCSNLVSNLPPLITAFFHSEAHRTGMISEESFIRESAYEPQFQPIGNPFNLNAWVENNYRNLKSLAGTRLFGQPQFSSEVVVFVEGNHQLSTTFGETFLWQMSGSSTVQSTANGGEAVELTQQDSILLLAETRVELDVTAGGWCLAIRMSR